MKRLAALLALPALIGAMIFSLPALVIAAGYLAVRPDGSPAQKHPVEPDVSVLIPTYNEVDIIEQKLRNILELDYPRDQIEVVLVDAGDDRTVEVTREVFSGSETPALRVVKQTERKGVATALNEGVEAASNPVIFRTDADSTLPSDAIQVATANLADPSVGAVTGRQVEVLGDSIVEADYRDMLSLIQMVESHIDSTYICHGPCFAFERQAYVPIPDDTIADDTEAGIRMREGGERVVFDPDLGFGESGVSEFSGRRRRKDRRAAGLIQTLTRHWESVGRYGSYGSIVLPLNWLLLIISPWTMATATVVTTLLGVLISGPAGLLIPMFVIALVVLGGREQLGPVQFLYVLIDSQVSLISGTLSLLTNKGVAIWEIDRESRDVFQE